MKTMPVLSRLQTDALRELANVASGHAATALADLVGRRTMIQTPRLSVSRVAQIPDLLGYGSERAVIVAMHLLGDLTGTLGFLLPVGRARALGQLLCGDAVTGADEFDALMQSALAETGNIIGGAYTGAIGAMMQRVVMLSTPAFGIAPPDNVLSSQCTDATGEFGLCIETRLTLLGSDAEFGGHIVLLPSEDSLRAIVAGLQSAEGAMSA